MINIISDNNLSSQIFYNIKTFLIVLAAISIYNSSFKLLFKKLINSLQLSLLFFLWSYIFSRYRLTCALTLLLTPTLSRYSFTCNIFSLKYVSNILVYLTIVSIEPTTYAKTPQETNMENIAQHFSTKVIGYMSPQPTVVMVWNAQYKHATYYSHASECSN